VTVEFATYIDSLSPDLPAGDDFLSEGDDHIRLIKQVLRQTFPNVAGPVTLTQGDLNLAGFPAGTRMLFQQASAPPGWFRVDFAEAEAMLRVVGAAEVDNTVRGVHSPVLNDIVVSHSHTIDKWPFNHTHTVNGTTGNENVNHAHYVSLGGGNHGHSYERGDGAFAVGTVGAQNRNVGPSTGWITGGDHTHEGWSGTENTLHVHAFSATSDGAAWIEGGNPNTEVTGEESWQPKYFDVMLCQRSAS